MAVLGLVSGRGAPGVTTSALALALGWPLCPTGSGAGPSRLLVVEADAVGSATVPGYLAGQVEERRGLASVLSVREAELSKAVMRNLVAIEGDRTRLLLPGLSNPEQMAAASRSWTPLARALQAASQSGEVDLLLDFGRWGARAEATELLAIVDLFVVVTRSDLLSLTGTQHVVRALREPRDGSQGVVCLMVGTGMPYRPSDVEASLAVPVAATLAWDPRTAAVFSHGDPPPRALEKAPLMRAAVLAASSLKDYADLMAGVHRTADADDPQAGLSAADIDLRDAPDDEPSWAIRSGQGGERRD